MVLADRELAARLRGLEPATFPTRVAAAARELGLDVTEEDVADEERRARRAWFERWLDG